VHRTVRWANGRQRNGRPPNPWVTRGSLQRSIGGTGLSGVHRTVSGAPTTTNLQRSAAPDLEGNRAPDMNSGLPRLPPMALSCLGAIKGTPRRMEEQPKHSLIIPKHQDSILANSILWDSDLSPIWVENSSSCVVSSSCGLCAWLCFCFESCVRFSSLPYFYASLWSLIVRARGSKLWRFLANGRKDKKGKHRGIQVDHWITWKGLSATLIHWNATTWSRQVLYLAEPRDKPPCLLCCLSLWPLCFTKARSLATWSYCTNS
jgi:hypothetical protein